MEGMMFNSMLDNDLYNFSMQSAALKLGYASVPVEYAFHCRAEGIDFYPMIVELNEKFNQLCDLKLTKDEYDYMRSLRQFDDEYLMFLKQFRFDPSYVKADLKEAGGWQDLRLRIKGPWFHTILFDVPLLSTISETWSDFHDGSGTIATSRVIKNVADIMELGEGFKFADFGTRRRKSSTWQEYVVRMYNSSVPLNFVGTSNMYLSMKHNIKAIGTMSHEWFQAHQQLKWRLVDSQKMALRNWVKVFGGDLGIALADIINTDAFLRDFDDPLLWKLFDGVREDSESDPIKFGHRIVNFYLSKGVDPLTKTIVFSNGLDFPTAFKIYNELKNLINLSFGIGTKLTNDWDVDALRMVIKMVSCNGAPVAKISNSPGKGMCESPEFVSYLRTVYQV
jgi:nicotinate phosphoribosyltransferase